MSRLWRCWYFLASLACLPRAAAKKKKNDDEEKKVLMQHHAFTPPLEYITELDDWIVSASSLVERDRLLLHPAIPERHALLISQTPLITENFEVVFQFRVVGDQGKQASDDQSIGFWFGDYNASSKFDEKSIIKTRDWNRGMAEAGFTFAGYQNRFKGFGLVMSPGGSQGSSKPVATYVSNDGSRELKYNVDAPRRESKAIDFRNTLNAAQMKIRVRPGAIEGHFKESPSLSWNEVFRVEGQDVQLPPLGQGFLGFTAWSGTARSDLVSLHQLEVYNHDDTKIGEEMRDVAAEIQNAYREMLTDDNRHFLDQKSQTDHLDRLTKMLDEHVNGTRVAEQVLFQNLETLQGRMGKLDDDCRTLTKEVQLLVNERHPKAQVGQMMQEIVGLRRIFVKDSASHRAKVQTVQKKVEEVKVQKDKSGTEAVATIAAKTESIEAVVQQRGSTMSWMLLVMFLAIVGVGILMFNRMRYYEKKHFI